MSYASRTFRDLIVWQRSHELVLRVYEITNGLPKEETFGLKSQIRRAAVSVPANIAEGFRKDGAADKARFLNIAEGSLEETKYYFILCADLNYFDDPALWKLAEETSKMLNAYRKAILKAHYTAPTIGEDPLDFEQNPDLKIFLTPDS